MTLIQILNHWFTPRRKQANPNFRTSEAVQRTERRARCSQLFHHPVRDVSSMPLWQGLRCAIALNNMGCLMLERNCHQQAQETFQDALHLVKDLTSFEPGTSLSEQDCDTLLRSVQSKLQQADLHISRPTPSSFALPYESLSYCVLLPRLQDFLDENPALRFRPLRIEVTHAEELKMISAEVASCILLLNFAVATAGASRIEYLQSQRAGVDPMPAKDRQRPADPDAGQPPRGEVRRQQQPSPLSAAARAGHHDPGAARGRQGRGGRGGAIPHEHLESVRPVEPLLPVRKGASGQGRLMQAYLSHSNVPFILHRPTFAQTSRHPTCRRDSRLSHFRRCCFAGRGMRRIVTTLRSDVDKSW
jgi:hypothetical protein